MKETVVSLSMIPSLDYSVCRAKVHNLSGCEPVGCEFLFNTNSASIGNSHPPDYNANILPKVCEVYLAAHDAGAILPAQRHVVRRAYSLMRGLAEVGIIALVDQTTGYQHVREERALATILEKFIAEDLQPWTKTFPFEFYEQICRLRKWPSINAVRRPSVIGRYTNDFVYDRIAPGVLEELKARTPRFPRGTLRNRYSQWFTPDYGHPKLKEHLAGVIALMRATTSWHGFRRVLQLAHPKIGK